jgi:hypothetical protein
MRVGPFARVQVVGAVMTLVIVALVTLGASPRARAAGPSSQSLDDEKQARGLYERAEKSFDLGKFAEALGEYQSAYEAKPLPGFLFNIAQCYRNMGNFERARFFFRRYLALDPHASNRRRVDELIAEMTKQLDAQGAEAPTAPPAVAPPTVPGTTPPAVPGATPIAGEPRPVEALASGAPPASSSAEILPPTSAASAPSASVSVVARTAPSVAEARRPVWKRWWFWTGVGAVVAGGVVAAFFLTRPETRTPGSLEPIDGRPQ